MSPASIPSGSLSFLPTAAQRAVIPSLLKAGLLEEVEAADGQSAVRVTDAGLLAIGTVLALPSGDLSGQAYAFASSDP